MTSMTDRIWATADIGMLGSTGRWVTQGTENPFGRVEYVRADLVERAILDAQLRAFERSRLDTPDEIRDAARHIREGKL